MPAMLQSYLLNLLYLGILAGITALAPKVVAFYKSHTTAQERATLASLADAAVPWVEKAFPTLPGVQQFSAAVAQAQKWLAARGISITASEVEAEVQRAYAQAKVNGTLAAASSPAPAQPAAKA